MKTATKPLAIISATSFLALVALSGAFVLQANAATTTVSSSIGSTMSVFTTSGTVNIDATPTAGGVQTINKDVITISTNDSSGYTLKLAETTAASALTSGGNTIPASSGTLASPVIQAVNTWGYRVDSLGTFGTGPTTVTNNAAISGTIKFAAVPATASPDTIKTTAVTASNDVTNVWYGVAVNTSTPTGTYTNSVTYTATNN